MLSLGSFYEEPSKYIFYDNSVWTLLFGLETSPITLALCYVVALVILAMCIGCTVMIEKKTGSHLNLLFLRTGLGILAGVLYLDVVFAKHLAGHRHFESGSTTIGLYGLLKTWELCLAPLLDGAPLPKWLRSVPNSRAVQNGTSKTEHRPLKKDIRPEHPKTALGYSLDLITNLRGVSWLGDRHFDFLPNSVVAEQASTPAKPAFIRDRLVHFLLVCACYDVCDTITKSQRWLKVENLVQSLPDDSFTMSSPHSPAFAHQVTTRPFYEQAIFVLIVAVTTQLSLETFYTLLAVICVGVFNVSPKAFPHFFSSPLSFHTDSVRSFWGARWHHVFRRIFDRATDPWLHLMGIPKRSTLRAILKIAMVFIISALFHCVIQAKTLVHYYPPGFTPRLLDYDTIRFFMSQPFALLFEHFVIRPLARRLPAPLAYLVRRVWTWGWLFWSARWWADTWVKMGMWQPEEQVVFFSPIRGLWNGDWFVQMQ